MLGKRNLSKTHFIPMEHMRKVIEVLQGPNPFRKKKKFCDNNLYALQMTRLNTFHLSQFGKMNWINNFSLACHKALYSHDWDRLLYLLKKVPVWKFPNSEYIVRVYVRHLTILLMYHPTSQAEGLLCEYLHMTWGCRTDQDKMAILKVLLHLPEKLPKPLHDRILKKSQVEIDD